MPDERDHEDVLNQFWNRLGAGEQPTVEAGLTPEEMAVVHLFHQAGTAPLPGCSPEAAWPRILARIEGTNVAKQHPVTLPHTPSISSPTMLPNGHAVGRPVPSRRITPARSAGRWAWGQWGTAALLLLTLVTSVVVFGRVRNAPPERSASLPAVVTTPTPEAPLEILFSAMLPAEMVPAEPGDRTFNAWHATLDPGARVPITGQIPGPLITHVVVGELTLRVDGPLEIYRSGNGWSQVETVPPGTEVVLALGDTAVYAYETPAEYANLGTSPVHVVGGDLGVGVVPGAPMPLTFVDYGEKYPLSALPPGPVQVTLVRATLAPDGTVPAPPSGSLVLAVGATEGISIGENADGSLRNIQPREITAYVLTLTPAGSASRTLTT
jgi:hypothetical protein